MGAPDWPSDVAQQEIRQVVLRRGAGERGVGGVGSVEREPAPGHDRADLVIAD